MTRTIGIVGAGIIGITNAICLLEEGFNVTILTKDEPLHTNSDAAVATWYIPDDSQPLLQQLCLESLPKLDELSKIPHSGVSRIPMIYYFKNEEVFKQTPWAREPLKTLLNISHTLPKDYIKHKDYPIAISAYTLLIDPNFYRPFMLKKFKELGGKIKKENIKSLSKLTSEYDIVLNCTGWETKNLTNDTKTSPIRGQIEIIKFNKNVSEKYSLNIHGMDAYVIYRPLSEDCVIGTTYQIGDTEKGERKKDRDEIIKKLMPFFPEATLHKTVSKVGIRCGRSDARIEEETISHTDGRKGLIIHCYGHGGSGFSAAWGSAARVLKLCLDHTQTFTPSTIIRCRL